ncbi:MAG: Fe-S cluster assembly sulfur transfer protein SufU [Gemmatimonadota bacterium]
MNDFDAPYGGLDDSSLSQLYQEVILDHYRKPRNKGDVEDVTHTVTMNNPLCGDVIDLLIRVKGGRIADIGFKGKGCSISQASASMMTERLKGKTVDEALALTGTFKQMLHGDAAAAGDAELGDLQALQGVSKFPVRVKCALLAWNCLEELVGPDA